MKEYKVTFSFKWWEQDGFEDRHLEQEDKEEYIIQARTHKEAFRKGFRIFLDEIDMTFSSVAVECDFIRELTD